MKRAALQGERFGRLVVVADAPDSGYFRMFLCRCDCGTKKIVRYYNLRDGQTRSCGCLTREEAGRIGSTTGIMTSAGTPCRDCGTPLRHRHGRKPAKGPGIHAGHGLCGECYRSRKARGVPFYP